MGILFCDHRWPDAMSSDLCEFRAIATYVDLPSSDPGTGPSSRNRNRLAGQAAIPSCNATTRFTLHQNNPINRRDTPHIPRPSTPNIPHRHRRVPQLWLSRSLTSASTTRRSKACLFRLFTPHGKRELRAVILFTAHPRRRTRRLTKTRHRCLSGLPQELQIHKSD
jgi:hypothetical protein